MIPRAEGHWLLGNAREFAGAPHRFPAEVGWKHGGLVRCRFLHKRFVVVTNPDYAHQILVKHHDRYERSYQYRNHEVIVGKSLLSTDGDFWLQRRRVALPAFRSENLKRVVPAACSATADLLEQWAGRQTAPIVGDMQRLAMAVISRALLSATDLNAGVAARFGQAVRDSLRLIRKRNTSMFNVPLSVPTRQNRRLHETRALLDEYVNGHLARRNEQHSKDMLDALLAARDPETGAGLSHQALLDETKTLFIAGFETTATALAWTLYLLARHPDAAARWHDEVDRVLEGEPPSWDHLDRLTWTHQVINETLRLYPPVYNMPRKCITEDALGGRVIRPGTIVLISIFGLHRSAQWWPSPDAFQPERFAEDRDWAKQAYLPFGLGKHTCIGNAFAMTEMKVILAMIGQHYRLELTESGPVPESPQITLVPSREIMLRLIPRQ